MYIHGLKTVDFLNPVILFTISALDSADGQAGDEVTLKEWVHA